MKSIKSGYFDNYIAAMSNYRMLSVNPAIKINLVGPNMNCPSSTIPSLANISTSMFPAAMTQIKYHSLAYAFDTSTLVACGGNQVNQAEDVEIGRRLIVRVL